MPFEDTAAIVTGGAAGLGPAITEAVQDGTGVLAGDERMLIDGA